MNVIKLIAEAYPEIENDGSFIHFVHQHFDCGDISLTTETEFNNIINSAEMIKFLKHKIKINKIVQQCGK